MQLPKSLCFLGEEIDCYAGSKGQTVPAGVQPQDLSNLCRELQDEEICLVQAPVGSAPAAQFMDWLAMVLEQIIYRYLWCAG